MTNFSLKNELAHLVFIFSNKKVTEVLNSEVASGKLLYKVEVIHVHEHCLYLIFHRQEYKF